MGIEEGILLKNLKLKKTGGSYGFIIPKGVIDHIGNIRIDEYYDLIIREKNNNDIQKN